MDEERCAPDSIFGRATSRVMVTMAPFLLARGTGRRNWRSKPSPGRAAAPAISRAQISMACMTRSAKKGSKASAPEPSCAMRRLGRNTATERCRRRLIQFQLLLRSVWRSPQTRLTAHFASPPQVCPCEAHGAKHPMSSRERARSGDAESRMLQRSSVAKIAAPAPDAMPRSIGPWKSVSPS